MIAEAVVSFTSFHLLLTHVGRPTMRKLVGYKGWVDVTLHSTILYMFFATSTGGLLQAELAGILFSLYLRGWSRWYGYDRLKNGRWVSYAGYKDLLTARRARA